MSETVRRGSVPIVMALTLSGLAGCAVAPPNNTSNACDIFTQYPDWYASAKASEKRWGTPVPIMLAIINQESNFRADAKSGRYDFLGIPLFRKSTSYGYGQALTSTWDDYQSATQKPLARRNSFHDTVDFIGWYNYQSYERNKIARNDTYYLYLAYHEGHTGYANQTYKDKQWLKDVSDKVARQAMTYDRQMKECRTRFDPDASGWSLFR
ncbi:transglycosylase SLT domain-containing protein [Oceanospirillum sediminis]